MNVSGPEGVPQGKIGANQIMELKVLIQQKGPISEGRAPEIVSTGLRGAMEEAVVFLVRAVKEEIEKKNIIGVGGAKGGFRASIQGDVIQKGTPVSKGESIIKGIVASQSAYGEVIEKGRRPGQKWPREGWLLKWIEVKLGVDPETAKRLEFVIRRKIGVKGFEGKHVFEEALRNNEPKLREIFERAGFQIATGLNEE